MTDALSGGAPDAGAVLVVGLGRFGSALAEGLERLGHEVLAVDSVPGLVQEWSDRITRVVQADATSEEAMRQLWSSTVRWSPSVPGWRRASSPPACSSTSACGRSGRR
jgi:UDP-N-acetylmuramoylalanine-D-glutamate ligase